MNRNSSRPLPPPSAQVEPTRGSWKAVSGVVPGKRLLSYDRRKSQGVGPVGRCKPTWSLCCRQQRGVAPSLRGDDGTRAGKDLQAGGRGVFPPGHGQFDAPVTQLLNGRSPREPRVD